MTFSTISGGDASAAEVPPRSPSAELMRFCVNRLRESLGKSGVLFDRQLRDRSWSGTRGTEALTSTAIVLIGLSRSGVSPSSIGLDAGACRDFLFRLARDGRHPGPLGLLLWASAATDGPPLGESLARLGIPIGGMSDLPRRLRTMELAWLLAGLAHERRREASKPTEAAFDAARLALLGRFEERTGLFRHGEADSPWVLRSRRWVATFADQIYPIQALALASMATGDARSLDLASIAADRMAGLQGDRGQWWWHFDPRDGRVSGSYPVYSVHQLSMAPMALRTLALAGGPDHRRAIEAGRSWLSDNELGVDLVDRNSGTIWRSIVRDEGHVRRWGRHARALLGRHDDRHGPTPIRLRVNHETRPYEWGWCLFALSLEAGEKPTEHLA